MSVDLATPSLKAAISALRAWFRGCTGVRVWVTNQGDVSVAISHRSCSTRQKPSMTMSTASCNRVGGRKGCFKSGSSMTRCKRAYLMARCNQARVWEAKLSFSPSRCHHRPPLSPLRPWTPTATHPAQIRAVPQPRSRPDSYPASRPLSHHNRHRPLPPTPHSHPYPHGPHARSQRRPPSYPHR
jgi:hypothetical protein